MIVFGNLAKLERAQRVVKDASRFTAESVERVALGMVNAREDSGKLSEDEKVEEVYKILGGAFREEIPLDPPVARKKAKK